ncbi:hemerythrin domain-containing protein [Humibacillus sp. DSM 29435]|uniref:hemerythrin domain-containing protein n=1 Tax=Humibacillus sp. DSM 29435 TaxID=1869167 RepID=UPI0009F5735D|nr:hemerythrin domain-containing protein [Humibacillus sp. DSM 29435]
MDITEIISHQHDEQRRMFAYLEEWPRDDHEGLAAVWKRLAILLETHAEAEERYFYPELLRLGTGGADAESTEEEVEDAVKDHNEIRAAVRAADEHETGSDDWWTAVIDANVHNSDHMGEEERQDLADFRQQASLELRHEIAVKFLRYEAQTAATGIEPKDKDPEQFVETQGDELAPDGGSAGASDSEREAHKMATDAAEGVAPTGEGDSLKSSPEAAEG